MPYDAADTADRDRKRRLRSRLYLFYLAGTLLSLVLFGISDGFVNGRSAGGYGNYLPLFQSYVSAILLYNILGLTLPALVVAVVFIDNHRVKEIAVWCSLAASLSLLFLSYLTGWHRATLMDAMCMSPIWIAIRLGISKPGSRSVRSAVA